MLAHHAEQTLHAEESFIRRARLLDAVSEKQHGVAGLQRHLDGVLELRVGVQPQGHGRALEQGLDFPARPEHVAGGMPRARVTKAARGRINLPEKQRDVTLLADVLRENAIGDGENFPEVVAVRREGAQIGARFGHEQRGTNAMSRDVRNDESDAPMHHGEVIKVVPPRGLGGITHARDVEAGKRGRSLGEKALLDFARDLELLLVLAQFLLSPLARRDVAGESDVVPFALQIQVAEGDGDDNLLPVLPPPDDFHDAGDAAAVPGAQVILDGLGLGAAQIEREQFAQRLAGQFVRLPAEDNLHGGIGKTDFALRVHEEHGVG